MAHQTVQNPVLPARVNPPAPLNTRCGADEWKLFKQMWQNYTIVAKLNTQTDEYQRALFLHAIGPDALTLYNGMCFPDPHTLNDVIAGFGVLLNLLKITLLHYAPYQSLATFVTACETVY